MKKKKKISHLLRLKHDMLDREVFRKEVSLCKQLFKKKKGCCWGKCEKCGVIPLLYKLHKGVIFDKECELKTLRKKILK